MKRRLSLLLGALAFVVPPLWAYYEYLALNEAVDSARSAGRYVCGLPFLAVYLLATLASSALSALSVLLGFLGFRALPAPR